MSLSGVHERHYPTFRVYTASEGGWVEVRAVPANRIAILNRSDSAIVLVPFLFGIKSKAIPLGVLSESPADIYRILAFGEIASPADESLEYSRQAAMETLYNFYLEQRTAKKRLAAIKQSDAALMAMF